MGNQIQNHPDGIPVPEDRIALRDGLYPKYFYNGITFIGSKPYTFSSQVKMNHLVRIKKGVPYLADTKGDAVEELVPISQEECLKRGVTCR